MKIVITGAASAIAQATARLWANDQASFFLIDRDATKLAAVADDLRVRGAGTVYTQALDLTEYEVNPRVWAQVITQLGVVDVLLVAHGILPNQAVTEQSWAVAHEALAVNFLSVVSLLIPAAHYFTERQAGTIAVITSVAGDRGRQSLYTYSAAKGGLQRYVQGVRNRLYKHGVTVLDIRPGYVDTPMTAGVAKGRLWVQPAVVGRDIVRAVAAHRDLLYTPRRWWLIMFIIRSIPERIFKRLSL